MIEVSLDGGRTFKEVNDVVVISVDRVFVAGYDEPAMLEIKITHEGVITDVWVADENTGTESEMFGELADRLNERNT